MARTVLTDEYWKQILKTMKSKGCYQTENSRNIMEAIIWKLRTGAPWRDIPVQLCPWKTAYNRFNRWSEKDLWADFFLACEAKLIKNGFSSMEVTSRLTNMRVELEKGANEQLELPEEGVQLSSTSSSMRMDVRSILKSLGVKFTIRK